jgi:uncharacterized protein with von Willebrand factor type A (vWA) domain
MTAPETIGAHSSSALPAGVDVTGRLELDDQCVFRDAYDEAAFRSLLEESPRLEECRRRGVTRLRSFPALLSDIFCLLFKLWPTLVDRSLVRPAFQVNRYLIARLAGEPSVKSLRAGTALDEEAAGAATVSLADHLLAELAETDLSEENLLFELEESLGEGEGARKGPGPTRRKWASGSEARDAGKDGGGGHRPLAYDLQQRLEMAEALKSFRSFERLLALAQVLVRRLTNDDPTRSLPTEVYDIDLGSELSRLLPSELVSLRASSRKRDFLRRLLGRQLLTYQISGRECSGSLVILVDVSHSMSGEKELASKALAIALSEVAAARGQAVTALLFGHGTAPLWRVDFRGRRPQRHQIVALAETFFGGGTDLERPISTALELISQRGDGGGQIVLISDGLCEVGEKWLSRILAAKARRRIGILTVLMDTEKCSSRAPASFSDQIVRWSELATG